VSRSLDFPFSSRSIRKIRQEVNEPGANEPGARGQISQEANKLGGKQARGRISQRSKKLWVEKPGDEMAKGQKSQTPCYCSVTVFTPKQGSR